MEGKMANYDIKDVEKLLKMYPKLKKLITNYNQELDSLREKYTRERSKDIIKHSNSYMYKNKEDIIDDLVENRMKSLQDTILYVKFIESIVKSLTPDQQKLIQLRYFESFTIENISYNLNYSLSTVKRKLKASLKDILTMLKLNTNSRIYIQMCS